MKPNPRSELRFILCYTKSGVYEDTEKQKVSYDIREYARKYLLVKAKDAYLAVSCSIDGHYIPMADIDSQKSLCAVSLWFKENKIKYSAIESSPGHYWVFPDLTFTNMADNNEFVRSIPKNDENYVKFLFRHTPVVRGFLRSNGFRHTPVVRGFLRSNGFMPRIVCQDAEDPLVNKFIDKLIEHLNSDEVEWIRRYEIYQSDTNIADPDFGKELNVTIQDMLSTSDLEPKPSLLRRIFRFASLILNVSP